VSGDITSVLAAVSCGTVVVVTEPVAIPLLRRASAIDVPGLRSSHSVPTPRGGGVPIALGLLVAAALIHSELALPFAVAVFAFAVTGFADDLRGLPVGPRLALQAVGGAAVGSVLVSHLGMPPAVLACVATVAAVWVVGFVNAFNFMDGVNGISAAHALIGGVTYGFLGTLRPDRPLVAAGAAIAASALAFLPWNAVRARVFLGDVGSYALGAALAVLAACAVMRGIPPEAVLGPLALYLADTAWTLLRRIRARERWFEPHRTHVYQQWCDVGWSHQRVTVTSAAGTVLLCLLGAVSLSGHPGLRVAADLAGIGVLVTYLRSPALLPRTGALPEAGLRCAFSL
jgi:UDP-GlcNAc:undecaprenyl-phosphate/decaprenyl-phosphate GlcNAc-1-phosphate transferase